MRTLPGRPVYYSGKIFRAKRETNASRCMKPAYTTGTGPLTDSTLATPLAHSTSQLYASGSVATRIIHLAPSALGV